MDDNPLSALATPPDNSVKDFIEGWGKRTHQRRTFGTPGRTRFVGAMQVLKFELEDLQYQLQQRYEKEKWTYPPPKVIIEDLEEFLGGLADSWGGEMGRDTNDFIRGIGAVKGSTFKVIPSGPAPQAEDRGQ